MLPHAWLVVTELVGEEAVVVQSSSLLDVEVKMIAAIAAAGSSAPGPSCDDWIEMTGANGCLHRTLMGPQRQLGNCAVSAKIGSVPPRSELPPVLLPPKFAPVFWWFLIPKQLIPPPTTAVPPSVLASDT